MFWFCRIEWNSGGCSVQGHNRGLFGVSGHLSRCQRSTALTCEGPMESHVCFSSMCVYIQFIEDDTQAYSSYKTNVISYDTLRKYLHLLNWTQDLLWQKSAIALWVLSINNWGRADSLPKSTTERGNKNFHLPKMNEIEPPVIQKRCRLWQPLRKITPKITFAFSDFNELLNII